MTVTSCARRILARLTKEARSDLAAGPIADAIQVHFDLNVRSAQTFGERGEGGWCDGVSIIESGSILYRPTVSRRANFTLAHELGHHLVDADDASLNWIADQPDPMRTLEQVCDHIAAAILIPADVIADVIDSTGPSAKAILELFSRTQASRSACAVAIVRQLPCDGFAVLAQKGSGEVFFAARARDSRPYAWQGDRIPHSHPLLRENPPTQTKAWWPYPDGTDRREYFMSTQNDSYWTVAVFAEDDLFGVADLHLPQLVEEDRGYDGYIACRCGYTGHTRWWPCEECKQSQCPQCNECACEQRARERVRCDNCYMSVQPHLLVDRLCDACR